MASRARGLLLAMLAGVGCGKAVDSSSSDDVDASAGDDIGDDVGEDDPGEEVDAATDGGDVDAAVESPERGEIVVFTRNYTDELGGVNPLDSTISAAFGDFEPESCVVELDDGDCDVLACTPRTPPASRPDAGPIDIEGVQSTAIVPAAGGVYEDLEVDQTILSDGGTLSVFAEGGDVPAFSIEELTVPYSAGFQPGTAPTAASSISVDPLADWSLSWGGIEASDTFRITLASKSEGGDGATRRIECSVGAGAGGVTISADAMSYLPYNEDLAFEAVNERSTSVTVGDFEIELVARVVNRVGDDASYDWARGTVTLVPGVSP